MPLECHALAMNAIELLLSVAVADISMLQCSAQFRIMFIHANFVADNASHALASSARAGPTFNVEEEVVVIRNGWTPKKIPSQNCFVYSKLIEICDSLCVLTIIIY